MSQTVRELLTELAWIEDSIRHVPLTIRPAAGADNARPAAELNADLVALADREREIIAELRQYRTSPAPT